MKTYIIVTLLIILILINSILVSLNKRNTFKQSLVCDEGTFLAQGKKERFIVKKGERFVFTVVNGQITEVWDKAVSSKPVAYGGITNGKIY